MVAQLQLQAYRESCLQAGLAAKIGTHPGPIVPMSGTMHVKHDRKVHYQLLCCWCIALVLSRACVGAAAPAGLSQRISNRPCQLMCGGSCTNDGVEGSRSAVAVRGHRGRIVSENAQSEGSTIGGSQTMQQVIERVTAVAEAQVSIAGDCCALTAQ